MKQNHSAMIAPQAQVDRRKLRRMKFTGLLPGIFRIENHAQPLICKPIDINKSGLGVLSDLEFNEGTVVTLQTSQQLIRLEVIWKKPDFGKRDLWRYGLVTLDQEIDLIEVFCNSGCLR